MKIVIARYSEDVKWCKQFSDDVIIYNKGEFIDECDLNQVMMSSNVGREGHTYYKYIVDNYDNLDEHIIFLQGNPFEHTTNIIEKLTKYKNMDKTNIYFEFISDCILNCNLNGCMHHVNLPLRQVYTKLFGETKKNIEFSFGAGGQFIVSKKKILSKPKEFYQKIVEMLEYDINPIEGFVIERFHKLIFVNKNGNIVLNKEYCKPKENVKENINNNKHYYSFNDPEIIMKNIGYNLFKSNFNKRV